jgi:hypothetical protein
MSPAAHLEKARSIMTGLKKLSASDDSLALIDGAMIAGFHYGNALFHRHGVLLEDVHANTPSKLEVPLAKLPDSILPALSAFTELEELRSRYVRDAFEANAAACAAVWRALDVMHEASRK